MKTCKVCNRSVKEGTEIQPEGDELYVIAVDNRFYLLLVGDFICEVCYKRSTWYKRVRD